MFTIVGAMAELERNVIRERMVAGLDHARARGTKSGQAIGRPRAVFSRAKVVELRDAGQSWRALASTLGISTGTARAAYGCVQKPSFRSAIVNGATTQVAGAL